MVLDMDINQIIDRETLDPKACVSEVNDIFEFNTVYSAFAALTPTASSEIWRRRMGHLGYDNLKKLTKVADGMTLSDARELFDPKFRKPDYDPCHITLSKRKPFGKAPRAKKEGDLIHTDLVTPLKPTGYDGSKGYMYIKSPMITVE